MHNAWSIFLPVAVVAVEAVSCGSSLPDFQINDNDIKVVIAWCSITTITSSNEGNNKWGAEQKRDDKQQDCDEA